jgi:hypothetical protein
MHSYVISIVQLNINTGQAIQDKILRDIGWTIDEFSTVDWEAYSTAYQCIPCLHRVSKAKIGH